MPHWTQTPKGRKHMSQLAKSRPPSRHWTQTPEGKQRLAEIKAARAAAATNGHAPTRSGPRARALSGRAMLVDLARPEAERRIGELEKQIETLRLFLAKTK